MRTSTPDFSANIERFSGFADVYDKYRPQPPAALASILTSLAQAPHPDLVVDLGSGTGLSTRYWADRATNVVGVEPTADMRRQAAANTTAANVSYVEGFSHQTGLPDRCADIVTCSQSLHWMEPQTTFEECRRILRPGGVFAASDYDWPPTTGVWEADAAYAACTQRVHAYEIESRPPGRLQRWEKSQHLARMTDSGCFRFTKEILAHHVEPGNAERLVGLLLSQGSVRSLLKAGASEAQLGIEEFRSTLDRTLGAELRPWYWSSRIRFGVV